MIGKDVESDDETGNLTWQLQLTENRDKILNDNYAQIQTEIRNCFARLTTILQVRERQLLHQAQTLHARQLSVPQENLHLPSTLNFKLEKVKELEQEILSFGVIHLSRSIRQQSNNTIKRQDDKNKKCVVVKETIGAEHRKALCEKQIEGLYTHELSAMDVERLYANLSGLCKFNFVSNIIGKSLLIQRLPLLRDLQGGPMILQNSFNTPQCSSLLKIKLSGDRVIEDKNFTDLSKKALCNGTTNLQTKHTTVLNSINEMRITENLLRDTKICVEIKVQSAPAVNLPNTKAPEIPHFSQGFNSNIEENRPELSVNKKLAKNQEILRNAYMHPKQIQQWLQQILVETEIEPTVHEIGQFSEISQVRFCNEFPVET